MWYIITSDISVSIGWLASFIHWCNKVAKENEGFEHIKKGY